jgi:hypothetical protein
VEKNGEVRQATNDNIMRSMHSPCLITKATDTLSAYVITIAFPRQQWLGECASILRYTCIACLVLSGLFLDTVMRIQFLNCGKFYRQRSDYKFPERFCRRELSGLLEFL